MDDNTKDVLVLAITTFSTIAIAFVRMQAYRSSPRSNGNSSSRDAGTCLPPAEAGDSRGSPAPVFRGTVVPTTGARP